MRLNLRPFHLLIATFVCMGISVIFVYQMDAANTYPLPAGPSAPAAVAGVTYQVQGSRPLDLVGDIATLRALPAQLRQPSGGDVLYGVFISATNSGDATQQLARRFELVDAGMQRFPQLPLAAGSVYRYSPGRLLPGQQAPANWSPVGENGAEQGYPLVFRLPLAASIERLTLRIFDPTGSASPGEIIVSA